MKKSKKFAALLMAAMAAVTLGGCATGNTGDNAEDNKGMVSDIPETNPPSSEAPPLYIEGEEPPTPEIPETPDPQVKTVSYVNVTGSSVNVRTGPGTDSEVLGAAQSSTRWAYLGKTGDWFKIYYKNREAYISAKYGELVQMKASGDDRIEAVIAEGTKVLGSPYVYGATRYHAGNGNLLSGFNVNEYDCSSLMQYIFKKGANVNLQMNTRTQVSQGVTVSKSELKRGDLMFFTNSSRQDKEGLERIGHVALYLGDGWMLHTANERDNARIQQVTSTWWGYYIQAQRMI